MCRQVLMMVAVGMATISLSWCTTAGASSEAEVVAAVGDAGTRLVVVFGPGVFFRTGFDDLIRSRRRKHRIPATVFRWSIALTDFFRYRA